MNKWNRTNIVLIVLCVSGVEESFGSILLLEVIKYSSQNDLKSKMNEIKSPFPSEMLEFKIPRQTPNNKENEPKPEYKMETPPKDKFDESGGMEFD